MHVWHHVCGIPGRLVGHPEQGGERRFIGKQRKAPDECARLRAEGGDLADLYDDVDELVKASGAEGVRLERTIGRGDLERLAQPVVAHSHAAALAKLPAQPSAAAPATAQDAKPEPAAQPAPASPPADAPPATAKRKGN